MSNFPVFSVSVMKEVILRWYAMFSTYGSVVGGIASQVGSGDGLEVVVN